MLLELVVYILTALGASCRRLWSGRGWLQTLI